MINNSKLERQRTEILVNTHPGGKTPAIYPPVLPYDPLTPPDGDNAVVVAAPNLVDNSDFDFSKNGYIASGAGDDDYECYNFYRQRFIKLADVATTGASNSITSASNKFKSTYTYPMDFVLLNGGASGEALSGFLDRHATDGGAKLYSDAGLSVPLNVSDTLTNAVLWFGDPLDETAANALKSSGHSLFAANEGTLDIIPQWDRDLGYGQIGSDVFEDSFDIATPLPINFVRAGLRYYFRILISQRPGTTPVDPCRLFLGIWDATTDQKRFLESSNLSLSVSPVGTTGATTYSYRIIADLDDGTEIMSDEITIANGNSTLSTSHYNRLTWLNSAGILNYRIYRTTGGVTKRIFTIRNGSNDYNDYGTDEGKTLGAMPTASAQRPIVYKVTPEFSLLGEGVWLSFLISFDIPSTYDSSLTTGRQWLRFGIDGTAGQERLFLFDRVMISTSNGGWQRSARDMTLIATPNPTSTPGDDGGQGGGGIDGCFVLNTPVIESDTYGRRRRETPIGAVGRGDFVFADNRVRRVASKPRDTAEKCLINVRLANGVRWSCSPSERFVTSRLDKQGTRIDEMTLGDTIQCIDGKRVTWPVITHYEKRELDEPVIVRTLSLIGGRTFAVGRLGGWRGVVERMMNQIRKLFRREPQYTKAIAHNRKADEGVGGTF